MNGAREEFERARAAGANVDDVDYNIALIELEQGELEAAERLLAGVLERNPERTHVRRELARVRFQGKTATIDETRAAASFDADAGYEVMAIPFVMRLDRDFVIQRAWEEATGRFEPVRLE